MAGTSFSAFQGSTRSRGGRCSCCGRGIRLRIRNSLRIGSLQCASFGVLGGSCGGGRAPRHDRREHEGIVLHKKRPVQAQTQLPHAILRGLGLPPLCVAGGTLCNPSAHADLEQNLRGLRPAPQSHALRLPEPVAGLDTVGLFLLLESALHAHGTPSAEHRRQCQLAPPASSPRQGRGGDGGVEEARARGRGAGLGGVHAHEGRLRRRF
mmetsp:Transcript_25711/g.64781  ORF Transcript_25711/g.64781 Transcript_25711/m.64781 type:complete len:209 (+) Transcript_25711:853-1479(+)